MLEAIVSRLDFNSYELLVVSSCTFVTSQQFFSVMEGVSIYVQISHDLVRVLSSYTPIATCGF